MHDLVIRGGTVVDGTGAPSFEADVAIDGGRIVAVGRVADRGTQEIDAKGLLVTPGFVDIHTHYDAQATWSSQLLSSSINGVTTALAWLAALPPQAAPLIYATDSPDAVKSAQAHLGANRAGQLVEDALAACAVAARNCGTRRFVVAGGETSGAVALALGITRLDIGPQIAPGVPWCAAQSDGHDVAITLKSSNFGADTFFAHALGMLIP